MMQGNMKMHILILDLCFIFLRFCIWNMIIKIVIYRDTRIYIYIYTHERLIIIFLWTFYTTQFLHSMTWTSPHCQLSLSGVSKAIVILLRESEWEKKNPTTEKIIYLGVWRIKLKMQFLNFQRDGRKTGIRHQQSV